MWRAAEGKKGLYSTVRLFCTAIPLFSPDVDVVSEHFSVGPVRGQPGHGDGRGRGGGGGGHGCRLDGPRGTGHCNKKKSNKIGWFWCGGGGGGVCMFRHRRLFGIASHSYRKRGLRVKVYGIYEGGVFPWFSKGFEILVCLATSADSIKVSLFSWVFEKA